MLIHRKFSQETGLYEFTTEREHWTELFRVEVDGQLLKSTFVDLDDILPRYFVQMEYNPLTNRYRYWHFMFFPYVIIRIHVVIAWFKLGQWVWRNHPDWLKLPEPGVAQTWFWPKYLRLPSWKNPKEK